jgi:hypothetical protein
MFFLFFNSTCVQTVTNDDNVDDDDCGGVNSTENNDDDYNTDMEVYQLVQTKCNVVFFHRKYVNDLQPDS